MTDIPKVEVLTEEWVVEEIGPTYRFKWSNYTLAKYIEGRRAVADRIRRDASTMIQRAEQIEQEMVELANSIEACDD